MNFSEERPVTIYVGGGTPSVISAELWRRFIQRLMNKVPTNSITEFTVECNPDSFSIEKAKAWLESGVTRLSIGIQSLNNRELRILGRAHSSEQAHALLNNPVLSEFASVGADIIWGLPGQTLGSLSDTMSKILSSPHIRHISAYELTIASNTPFGRHKSILPLPEEEEMHLFSKHIAKGLKSQGFIRYEVSNWALPGFESRHNSSYWHHVPYIGLGPSAHSFVPFKRWANTSDHSRYLSLLNENKVALEFEESLTPDEIGHEMILLSLRTSRGLDTIAYKMKTGKDFFNEERIKTVSSLVSAGFIQTKGGFLVLTDEGMNRADGIAAMFV